MLKMHPHIWRKRRNFTFGGYMWIVLYQAKILKRHSGTETPMAGGKKVGGIGLEPTTSSV